MYFFNNKKTLSFFLPILILFILTGCNPCTPMKFRCNDNQIVTVERCIDRLYPVYAPGYEISFNNTLKYFDLLLTSNLGLNEKIIELRGKLNAENQALETKLKTCVIMQQRRPCDKDTQDKLTNIVEKILIKEDQLEVFRKNLDSIISDEKKPQEEKKEEIKNLMENLQGQLNQPKESISPEKESPDKESKVDNPLSVNENKLMENLTNFLEKQKIETINEINVSIENKISKVENEIKKEMKNELGNVKNSLSVDLLAPLIFESGKAQISSQGRVALLNIGEIIKDFPDKILLVLGHTDDMGISNQLQKIYHSNYELSLARAENVMRFLITDVGISPEKVKIAGFSKDKPLASNKSNEGRERNRRVEIYLVPKELANFY